MKISEFLGMVIMVAIMIVCIWAVAILPIPYPFKGIAMIIAVYLLLRYIMLVCNGLTK